MKLPSLSALLRVPLLAVLIGIPVPAGPAHAQLGKPEGLYYKSWGVVIGIENYLLAPKIPGAVEDAKAVAEVLRKLGFEEVVELYDKDASSRRVQQTLVDFLPRKVGRQDRLVIYFAGHAGITQTASGKDLGYLVPWDAQPGNVSKAVTFEQLKEFSHRSASKHTLFLFDTAVRGWEASAAQALSLEGRSAPEEDTDVLLLTDSNKAIYPVFVQRKVKQYLSAVTTLSQKSPHVLRHTYATHLLNRGADLNAIKELLGHANLAATQIYTHNSIEKLKKSHQQAHPKA